MVWRLYRVCVWSVSLPPDNIICSFCRLHISDYVLYRTVFIYVCTIFVRFRLHS